MTFFTLLHACCRHQWYQLHSKVTVDVYAKNMSKDQVRTHSGISSVVRVATLCKAGALTNEKAHSHTHMMVWISLLCALKTMCNAESSQLMLGLEPGYQYQLNHLSQAHKGRSTFPPFCVLKVSVTFGEQHLTVVIKEDGKEDYVLDVELCGKVG